MQYFKPIKTLLKFYFKRNFKIKTTSKMTEHSLSKPTTFETLKFDNLVLRTLPIDPITDNYIREVPNACFSKVIIISKSTFAKRKNLLFKLQR